MRFAQFGLWIKCDVCIHHLKTVPSNLLWPDSAKIGKLLGHKCVIHITVCFLVITLDMSQAKAHLLMTPNARGGGGGVGVINITDIMVTVTSGDKSHILYRVSLKKGDTFEYCAKLKIWHILEKKTCHMYGGWRSHLSYDTQISEIELCLGEHWPLL